MLSASAVPKPKARPLLILWPFGTVALVYDELDTEGRDLPRDVRSFYAEGPIGSERIESIRSLIAGKSVYSMMVDEALLSRKSLCPSDCLPGSWRVAPGTLTPRLSQIRT